jgi:hypothetical protein
VLDKIKELKKALEAGNYNAAPGAMTQGSALQQEDLSNIMNVATFQDSAIKLQKEFKVVPAKGTLVQFNRQLDYGIFGGSAVLEGAVGQEETSNYARLVVPMAYYVHVRRVTLQAEMVQTFDGVKAEDRVAADAAVKLAADIEFHLFRGKSAYSNAGLFDGNPLAASELEPGMHGLDMQIRQSDFMSNAQDLMLNEYGADSSVAINQNGVLAQSTVEDIYSRAQMHNGAPEKLYMDPLTHGAYNKIAHGKERIVLAGSPQQATGAQLKEQWVAGGAISIESSRFLSGKTAPARPRLNTPAAPSIAAAAASDATSFLAGEVYSYKVTACNEVGESVASAAAAGTIASNGQRVDVTITPASGLSALFFNVYRSEAGGSVVKFIGRCKNSGAATTVFSDKAGKIPAFVTGFALDMRGIEMHELSPFKKQELARTDLTSPHAFYRFCSLAVKLPRFSMIVDNLSQ